jgi:hypothetical protein
MVPGNTRPTGRFQRLTLEVSESDGMLFEAQSVQWQSPLHTDVIERDLLSCDHPQQRTEARCDV